MRINIGEEENPEIGLIALIDCIFFLLMFFMVATSFKQQNQKSPVKELPVTLPTASASLDSSSADREPLVIGLDRDGAIFLDGKKSSLQALHSRLIAEANIDKTRPLRIDADQLTRYKDVVHILDICQFEKLNNIALHTRN